MVRTTRHFTVIFQIYLTPENGTKHLFFHCPSTVVKKWQKSSVFIMGFSFQTPERDFTLYKYILFSCCKWNKRFF
uniref:Uncharacterized protein n=1 Tax=Anguilla anguilla TaxID=7936 RepID=A0A0E9XNF6_ANGAN